MTVRGFGSPIILQTGPLDRPFAALEQCTTELVSHWGIDAVAHQTLSRKATAKHVKSWVPDFPHGQLIDNSRAMVHLRLAINTAGRVTQCNVQQSAPQPDFVRTACQTFLEKAVFDPALDAQGEAIASYYLLAVAFTG
ncbi:energy transducer TonB [Croceicoccus sp. F390]|uniref:Energy transducer TonB n=1 Tax=Croceicoccus esteveae TaxID=3075597 RepID=A0ABU2ZIG1_9SPHN|nr:energy transducer TonB [Croceicoccus sp. F390]MDT0575808.1 energy transducer TonB [Croceicoccus sp. F390]